MQKLIFDASNCDEYYIPFEYESKEKYIFDVLNNPMILNKIGIHIDQSLINDKTFFGEKYIKNIEAYVFTLDEWFENNKRVVYQNV